jgi:hypothetical protein
LQIKTHSHDINSTFYFSLCSEVGKVIGGTKGNKILEYVSGAPNKATVVDEVPNIFDYDQLTKYGYGVSLSVALEVLVPENIRFSPCLCLIAFGDTHYGRRGAVGNVQTDGYGASSSP